MGNSSETGVIKEAECGHDQVIQLTKELSFVAKPMGPQ